MKSIFVSIIISILFSTVSFAKNKMASSQSSIPFSLTKLNEIKKGTITAKGNGTFTVQSDGGDTFNAPVEEGYDVGDRVWHSEPLGHVVLILGLASTSIKLMGNVHTSPVKWK